MSRTKGEVYRDFWWGEKLEAADTPKKKLTVLQAKILADISKLPEEEQDPARELAVTLLEQVIDEIEIRRQEERWTA